MAKDSEGTIHNGGNPKSDGAADGKTIEETTVEKKPTAEAGAKTKETPEQKAIKEAQESIKEKEKSSEGSTSNKKTHGDVGSSPKGQTSIETVKSANKIDVTMNADLPHAKELESHLKEVDLTASTTDKTVKAAEAAGKEAKDAEKVASGLKVRSFQNAKTGLGNLVTDWGNKGKTYLLKFEDGAATLARDDGGKLIEAGKFGNKAMGFAGTAAVLDAGRLLAFGQENEQTGETERPTGRILVEGGAGVALLGKAVLDAARHVHV